MNWHKESMALKQVWDEGIVVDPDSLDGEWEIEMATGPIWAFADHQKIIEKGKGKNVTTIFGLKITWGRFIAQLCGLVYKGKLLRIVDELVADSFATDSDGKITVNRILGRFNLFEKWFMGYFWMTRMIDDEG